MQHLINKYQAKIVEIDNELSTFDGLSDITHYKRFQILKEKLAVYQEILQDLRTEVRKANFFS